MKTKVIVSVLFVGVLAFAATYSADAGAADSGPGSAVCMACCGDDCAACCGNDCTCGAGGDCCPSLTAMEAKTKAGKFAKDPCCAKKSG